MSEVGNSTAKILQNINTLYFINCQIITFKLVFHIHFDLYPHIVTKFVMIWTLYKLYIALYFCDCILKEDYHFVLIRAHGQATFDEGWAFIGSQFIVYVFTFIKAVSKGR